MVDMSVPGTVKGDQTTSVNCPAEDVLWNKFAFAPDYDLAP